MKFMTLALGGLLSALLVTSPALAQSERLPDGVTQLNLNVTEQTKVQEDIIVSNLRYEVTNDKAQVVQDEINKAMTKALASIKKEKDVEVTTEGYQVYDNGRYEEQNGKKVKRDEWRGSQSLVMKSENFAAIQKLTGELQAAGFVTSGFGYTLSPEKAREVRETLLKGAVDKIKKQAEQAATLLGKNKYDIREISIDGGGYYPRPMPMAAMRMEAADSKVAPPVAEGGEQDVSLTVNARVELK